MGPPDVPLIDGVIRAFSGRGHDTASGFRGGFKDPESGNTWDTDRLGAGKAEEFLNVQNAE